MHKVGNVVIFVLFRREEQNNFRKNSTLNEDQTWDARTLGSLVLHSHAFLTELT